MNVTFDNFKGVTIVRLGRRLAMADVPAVRRSILERIDGEHPRLILDLGQVEFVDSSGLSVLVSAQQAAQAVQGDVVLLNPRPVVRSLIELTRLHELFEIFGHEGNAVDRLSCEQVD
jgi:anti-sigma B factor antagonist